VIRRRSAGRLLIAIGVLGMLAGLGGIVLGQLLVSSVDDALSRSLVLTGESVDALEEALRVSEETVQLVEGGLLSAEATTHGLTTTIGDGATLLRTTADLTEQRLAGSLAAFEQSLPGLIDVASVIDRTLRTLAGLPFGPSYNPPEPFDVSLRELQASLVGVPEDLERQAVLLRQTGDSLDQVGDGAGEIAEDLREIREGLGEALEVLRGSTVAAESARTLVADTQADLDTRLTLARVLIVLFGIATIAGQLVPLGLGWILLHPVGERPLLREDRPADEISVS
jgi:methyl-accepting chemotaxis protein